MPVSEQRNVAGAAGADGSAHTLLLAGHPRDRRPPVRTSGEREFIESREKAERKSGQHSKLGGSCLQRRWMPAVAAPGNLREVQARGAVGGSTGARTCAVSRPREAAGPVSHLVLTYGYLAVFGLITAEYTDVPVPGEAALILGAAHAGHTHRLSVWLILVLAVVAAILGYLAGLQGGYRLLLRWGPAIRLDHAKIKAGWVIPDPGRCSVSG
jgi:hypothetical protein